MFRVSPRVTLLAGRALLRISEHQLDRLGIEPESQQEILQDLLLLRVQEELENLNDIFSGQDMNRTALSLFTNYFTPHLVSAISYRPNVDTA